MTETVDAVVVGAGQNGLVAANVLADAGWSVLVLEAQPEPGGAVRTAEITAPGFRSDLCSAFYPLGRASPVLQDLGLDAYGLVWKHAPLVLAHVLADDRCVALSQNIDETAASVASFAPKDAGAWRDAFDQWLRIRHDLLDSVLRPFPPVRSASNLVRRIGVAEAYRLVRMVTLPVRRLGEELFDGEGAKLLFAGNALHTDLGPDNAGSGVFGWLLAMAGQDVGFPVPEGGAERLITALVRRLADRGGRVECNRAVRDVLIAGNRAMGVRDEHGELVRARRAVLADVPAPTLYRELVGEEHLPSRFVADLERFQWDNATIKVDWALSGRIPWTAPEARRSGVVHLDADLDGLTGYAADLACGRVPGRPFLLLGQMTTADPSRSPAGTESVWAYTHVPRGERWDRGRLEAYADRMQDTIERRAPGFTGLVRARCVQGPGELQEHNQSLVEGAINAGTAAIHQQFVFRPVPGLSRADTPVDRLYLAGASAHPGGAVHGAPGANAARAALARNGMAGGLYRATIQAAHRVIYS
ncbi:phytoene desaturase family protein [Amycolatopsis thermophila]|uniref:Phytoene dehydrogenase-like protein n=1 Tax=Amycolatopsis thermophila TaxID=206084 RepID=A0ABU0EVX1_9PSEU|nr:NAD(P)/FAD-dependent oxidoreductase [Amycolatopsis thermophila]MDQ0379455.1 phytoene dehydrogenase-like protein [Amycolatopsis thermophila]